MCKVMRAKESRQVLKTGGNTERERERESMCVCVTEKERERERERGD